MAVSKRQLEERKMRQERILDGALEVFKSEGLDGATMDEMLPGPGLAKRHFIIIFIPRKKYLLQLWRMVGKICGPVWRR